MEEKKSKRRILLLLLLLLFLGAVLFGVFFANRDKTEEINQISIPEVEEKVTPPIVEEEIIPTIIEKKVAPAIIKKEVDTPLPKKVRVTIVKPRGVSTTEPTISPRSATPRPVAPKTVLVPVIPPVFPDEIPELIAEPIIEPTPRLIFPTAIKDKYVEEYITDSVSPLPPAIIVSNITVEDDLKGWLQIDTDYAKLVFQRRNTDIAKFLSTYVDDQISVNAKYLNYELDPRKKIKIVLYDTSDIGSHFIDNKYDAVFIDVNVGGYTSKMVVQNPKSWVLNAAALETADYLYLKKYGSNLITNTFRYVLGVDWYEVFLPVYTPLLSVRGNNLLINSKYAYSNLFNDPKIESAARAIVFYDDPDYSTAVFESNMVDSESYYASGLIFYTYLLDTYGEEGIEQLLSYIDSTGTTSKAIKMLTNRSIDTVWNVSKDYMRDKFYIGFSQGKVILPDLNADFIKFKKLEKGYATFVVADNKQRSGFYMISENLTEYYRYHKINTVSKGKEIVLDADITSDGRFLVYSHFNGGFEENNRPKEGITQTFLVDKERGSTKKIAEHMSYIAIDDNANVYGIKMEKNAPSVVKIDHVNEISPLIFFNSNVAPRDLTVSQDGTELAFIYDEQNRVAQSKIAIVHLDDGNRLELLRDIPGVDVLDLQYTDNQLYFTVDSDSVGISLYKYNSLLGTNKPIAIDPVMAGIGFEVSDGYVLYQTIGKKSNYNIVYKEQDSNLEQEVLYAQTFFPDSLGDLSVSGVFGGINDPYKKYNDIDTEAIDMRPYYNTPRFSEASLNLSVSSESVEAGVQFTFSSLQDILYNPLAGLGEASPRPYAYIGRNFTTDATIGEIYYPFITERNILSFNVNNRLGDVLVKIRDMYHVYDGIKLEGYGVLDYYHNLNTSLGQNVSSIASAGGLVKYGGTEFSLYLRYFQPNTKSIAYDPGVFYDSFFKQELNLMANTKLYYSLNLLYSKDRLYNSISSFKPAGVSQIGTKLRTEIFDYDEIEGLHTIGISSVFPVNWYPSSSFGLENISTALEYRRAFGGENFLESELDSYYEVFGYTEFNFATPAGSLPVKLNLYYDSSDYGDELLLYTYDISLRND